MELRFEGDDKFHTSTDGVKRFLPCLKVVLKKREESRHYSVKKCADLCSISLPSK